MISRIKTSLMLAAMLFVPVAAHAQLASLISQSGGGNPIAFCCAQSSSRNGQGCYAVTNGPVGIGQCKSIYLDCGGSNFECTPSIMSAGAAGAPAGTALKDCQCLNFFIPSAAK